MAVGEEIVEVAGMEVDVVMAEKVDGEIFVGSVSGRNGGIAEDGVPAGVGVEEFAGGLGAKEGLQFGAIFADAGEELRAKGVALGQEHGKRGLRGGADG